MESPVEWEVGETSEEDEEDTLRDSCIDSLGFSITIERGGLMGAVEQQHVRAFIRSDLPC